MAGLLLRNVDPALERELKKRAKESGESLSTVAQKLIRRGLAPEQPKKGLGTEIRNLAARNGYFDIEIERDKSFREPPDF
jgi:plasmid stability protein